MLQFFLFKELSAANGGIILILILLIISATVFAVKFAFDAALNKKLNGLSQENGPENENNFVYAVKNDTARKNSAKPSSNAKYTIIPENKLFILEKPPKNKRN